jgi:hypothetical protein
VKVIELSKNDVFTVCGEYVVADPRRFSARNLLGKKLVRCYVNDTVHAMDITTYQVHPIYGGTDVEVVGTMELRVQ